MKGNISSGDVVYDGLTDAQSKLYYTINHLFSDGFTSIPDLTKAHLNGQNPIPEIITNVASTVKDLVGLGYLTETQQPQGTFYRPNHNGDAATPAKKQPLYLPPTTSLIVPDDGHTVKVTAGNLNKYVIHSAIDSNSRAVVKLRKKNSRGRSIELVLCEKQNGQWQPTRDTLEIYNSMIAGNLENIPRKFLKTKKNGGGLNERGKTLKDFFETSEDASIVAYRRILDMPIEETHTDETISDAEPPKTIRRPTNRPDNKKRSIIAIQTGGIIEIASETDEQQSIKKETPPTIAKETPKEPPVTEKYEPLDTCPEKVLRKICVLQEVMDVYFIPYLTSKITNEHKASKPSMNKVKDAINVLIEYELIERMRKDNSLIYRLTSEGKDYLDGKPIQKKQRTVEHSPIFTKPQEPAEKEPKSIEEAGPKKESPIKMLDDSIFKEIINDFKKLDNTVEETRYSKHTVGRQREQKEKLVDRGGYLVKLRKPTPKKAPQITGTLMYTTQDAPDGFTGAIYIRTDEENIFCLGYVTEETGDIRPSIEPSIETVYARISGAKNRQKISKKHEYPFLQELFEEQLKINSTISEKIAKDIVYTQKYRNLRSIITRNKDLTENDGEQFFETAEALFNRKNIAIPVNGDSSEVIELAPNTVSYRNISATIDDKFKGKEHVSGSKKHHKHEILNHNSQRELKKRARQKKNEMNQTN